MAGVLEQRQLVQPHRHLRRPGRGPGPRVGDRELVEQRVGVDAREPLDQVAVRRRAPPAVPGAEVDGLDDQRVAFPAAARLPRPRVDAGPRLPVERDDARIVHHLVEHHHVVRRLEELHVLVVAAGGHRRPLVEAEDAAVERTAIEPRIGRMLRPPRPPLLRAPLSFFRQRGDAPVRRIDDQRRAPGLDDVGAAVHPEVVVGADVAARLGAAGLRLPEPDVAIDRLLFAVRRLFLGQELLVPELLRPLQRRDRAEVPHALQIRRAPRRPGRFVLPGRRRRRQRRERQRRQPRHEPSTSHLDLPGRGRPRSRCRFPAVDPYHGHDSRRTRSAQRPRGGRGLPGAAPPHGVRHDWGRACGEPGSGRERTPC